MWLIRQTYKSGLTEAVRIVIISRGTLVTLAPSIVDLTRTLSSGRVTHTISSGGAFTGALTGLTGRVVKPSLLTSRLGAYM